MMNTITLSKEQIYTGNLILVNANLPLNSYSVKELIPAFDRIPHILLRREPVNILKLILEKISCTDEIIPVSGYRSANEQTAIYENSLLNNGEEFTRKFVALPFHSEHQTGLAIDLGLKKDFVDFICPEFPYNGICNEFRKLAPYYGFIERYQKGKEQITGIAHEPWHFRYVGHPHSEIMYKNELSLEEYIEYIKKFKYNKNHLKLSEKGKEFEIFYVPMITSESIDVDIPKHAVYQISGNNIDGFIVTLLRCKNE